MVSGSPVQGGEVSDPDRESTPEYGDGQLHTDKSSPMHGAGLKSKASISVPECEIMIMLDSSEVK